MFFKFNIDVFGFSECRFGDKIAICTIIFLILNALFQGFNPARLHFKIDAAFSKKLQPLPFINETTCKEILLKNVRCLPNYYPCAVGFIHFIAGLDIKGNIKRCKV
jgi:hypothetical protein